MQQPLCGYDYTNTNLIRHGEGLGRGKELGLRALVDGRDEEECGAKGSGGAVLCL